MLKPKPFFRFSVSAVHHVVELLSEGTTDAWKRKEANKQKYKEKRWGSELGFSILVGYIRGKSDVRRESKNHTSNFLF